MQEQREKKETRATIIQLIVLVIVVSLITSFLVSEIQLLFDNPVFSDPNTDCIITSEPYCYEPPCYKQEPY